MSLATTACWDVRALAASRRRGISCVSDVPIANRVGEESRSNRVSGRASRAQEQDRSVERRPSPSQRAQISPLTSSDLIHKGDRSGSAAQAAELKGPTEWFTGDVWIDPIVQPGGESSLNIG